MTATDQLTTSLPDSEAYALYCQAEGMFELCQCGEWLDSCDCSDDEEASDLWMVICPGGWHYMEEGGRCETCDENMAHLVVCGECGVVGASDWPSKANSDASWHNTMTGHDVSVRSTEDEG